MHLIKEVSCDLHGKGCALYVQILFSTLKLKINESTNLIQLYLIFFINSSFY